MTSGSGTTVGFAGIGRMGLPMARNVLRAGLPLVVWNRTADRCAPLVEDGATTVGEPAQLAGADVVVTMLADGQAARAVLVDSGLLAMLRPGSAVLEMSTIGPAAAQELADIAGTYGVHLLDAPVSGSVAVAERAQLFAMVGGSEEGYARATPVLDAMTKGHVHLGRPGAGAAMKLAVNAMIAVTNASIAETLALAERFGIDRSAAYDVLAGGALASPFLLYKRDAFIDPDGAPVAFTSALMRKDMALAQALAAHLDARLEVAAAAAGLLDEAVDAGLGEADIASVVRLLALDGQRQTSTDDSTEGR